MASSDASKPTVAQIRQAELILKYHNGDGAPAESRVNVPPNWESEGADTFYREHHLLVRHEYLDQALSVLSGGAAHPASAVAEGELPSHVKGVLAGVHLVRISQTVAEALATVNARLGRGVAAPDYLLSITVGGFCPATEPQVPSGSSAVYPPVDANPAKGSGVKVLVPDTGFDPTRPIPWAWLQGVTADDDIRIHLKSPDPNTLDPYAGHGTFIAGVVRCLAPGADVVVRDLFTPVGSAFESDLIPELIQVISADNPDVISLSAGTTCLADGLSFVWQSFLDDYLVPLKKVLVAAAGNNGGSQQFYPAAVNPAVAVGALNATLDGRAIYSDFGGWVDVFAPGTDIVNAYPTGEYTTVETTPPGQVRTFTTGLGQWSGTSFSTPVVAGLTAARIWQYGESPQAAADAVVSAAPFDPAVGGKVIIP